MTRSPRDPCSRHPDRPGRGCHQACSDHPRRKDFALQSLPDDDVVAVWKIAAECEKTVPERTVAAARTAYYHANPDRPQPQKPCKKEATTAAPRPRILSSVGRWLSMLWLLIVRAFLWLVGKFSAGKKGGP